MLQYLKFAAALIVFVFFSCHSDQKQQNKAAIIRQLVDSLYQAKIFNGAIVIADDDSIIFSKGYGYADFNDSVPFTPTTLSDGGSLAKTFTAEALWKLQRQGKVSLKDPVQTYLPLYPYPNTSVLDLLSHNAGGLPDYDYFFSLIGDTVVLTNELMLSLLHTHKPVLPDPSRQGFNYENCGMDMAVLVLEKVTGKKCQQALSELFFQALHMDSTHVRPALFSQWKTLRTTGYIRRNDSLILHDIADREGFHGGGNLHFTASDLCKWGMSLYTSHMHDDMAEQMQPAVTAGKASGLTRLNWYHSKQKKAFYYWGNVAGFYSHLYHDDEKKFTIAFMTNTTLPYSLRQPVAASLVEIMESGNYNKEYFKLPGQLVIKNPAAFFGIYKTLNGDSIHFFKGTHNLHVRRNNDLRYNVFIVDSVTAYAPGIDAWIYFSTHDNKRILHWNSVFQREQAERIE